MIVVRSTFTCKECHCSSSLSLYYFLKNIILNTLFYKISFFRLSGESGDETKAWRIGQKDTNQP